MNTNTFPKPPPFHHLWAIIVFFAQLFAHLLISFFSVPAVFDHLQYGQDELVTDDASPDDRLMEVFMLLITITAAFFLAILYHVLIKYLPKTMFWITAVLCNGLLVSYMIYSILRVNIAGAVISGLVWLAIMVILFMCRQRIPFDTLALTVVTKVTRTYVGVTWTSVAVLMVTSAWTTCFAFTVAGLTVLQVSPLIIYCVFSYLYTLSVLKNTLRLATLRSFLAYFLLAGSDRLIEEERGLSLRNLFYASTYQFGSVCYASMFVGMSHLFFDWGTTPSTAWDQEGSREKNQGSCGGLRTKVMSKFNTYAWSHMAIYGNPVGTSASDAWESITTRGVDAIVGPTLIHYLLLLSNVVVGFLSAFCMLLFVAVAQPHVYAQDVTMVELYLVLAWLIGVVYSSVMTLSFDAGVAGLAVVLASDPKAVQKAGEDALYELIWERYPEVVAST